jgi:hypothetical protein
MTLAPSHEKRATRNVETSGDRGGTTPVDSSPRLLLPPHRAAACPGQPVRHPSSSGVVFDSRPIEYDPNRRRAGAIHLERAFGDYWLPRLGPNAVSIVIALRTLIFYEPKTRVCRNRIRISRHDLAARVGISLSTLNRQLARNEALRRFVQREPGDAANVFNVYTVALFDPAPEGLEEAASPDAESDDIPVVKVTGGVKMNREPRQSDRGEGQRDRLGGQNDRAKPPFQSHPPRVEHYGESSLDQHHTDIPSRSREAGPMHVHDDDVSTRMSSIHDVAATVLDLVSRLLAAGMDDAPDLQKLAYQNPQVTQAWLDIVAWLPGIRNRGGYLRRQLEQGQPPSERQRDQARSARLESERQARPLRAREEASAPPEAPCLPPVPLDDLAPDVLAEAEERLRAANHYVASMKPGHIRNAVLYDLAQEVIAGRSSLDQTLSDVASPSRGLVKGC